MNVAQTNSSLNTNSFWSWEIKSIILKLHPEAIFKTPNDASCKFDSQHYLNILAYVPYSNSLSSIKSKTYTISILFQEKPNAFAMPSIGSSEDLNRPQIFISTGLLKLLRSEAELAFVIAHEESHIALDHFSPEIPMMMLTTHQINHIIKIKQGWEYEADSMAITLMQGSGFKQSESISLLKRLSALDVTTQTPFSKHHPPSEERIAKIRVYLSQNIPKNIENVRLVSPGGTENTVRLSGKSESEAFPPDNSNGGRYIAMLNK